MKSDNRRKSASEAGWEDREERIAGDEADFARANTNEKLFTVLLASAPAPVTDPNRPNLVSSSTGPASKSNSGRHQARRDGSSNVRILGESKPRHSFECRRIKSVHCELFLTSSTDRTYGISRKQIGGIL